MDIGEKIKSLRLQLGLTQEELADRAELSKGFISQLERNLTSPSIASLIDILGCLGVSPQDFFTESVCEKIIYSPEDIFAKEIDGTKIEWLITNAQKNMMEPIMMTLAPQAASGEDRPHEGEEFGHVLTGRLMLRIGGERHSLKAGDSFYFTPSAPHELINIGQKPAKILWVSSPPTF